MIAVIDGQGRETNVHCPKLVELVLVSIYAWRIATRPERSFVRIVAF
jgi:hypothetical protein